MRQPGIEPGSTAWKAAMLTTIPLTLMILCSRVSLFSDSLVRKTTRKNLRKVWVLLVIENFNFLKKWGRPVSFSKNLTIMLNELFVFIHIVYPELHSNSVLCVLLF